MFMENIVSSALQRLRASDIIRMAGLAVASLGQEYYRAGVVQQAQRQGARIAGVVSVPSGTGNGTARSTSSRAATATIVNEQVQSYSVEVEIQSSTSWSSRCSCGQDAIPVLISNGTNTIAQAQLLCVHAATLLYQWIARPMSFSSEAAPLTIASPQGVQEESGQREQTRERATRTMNSLSQRAHTPIAQRGPTPLNNLTDILTQAGLSELRNMAREYDITTNGLSKQQLVEAILQELHRPEVVRRVASTLEKPQRQLLAALSLAGGTMMDEDLRGLFERFKLGQPSQLQGVLLALQNKGLLFRTSMNSSPQQRIGLSGVLLDIGWYVPEEVRSALHVMTPITHYDLEEHAHEIKARENADPEFLLTTLLLVARCIEEHQLSNDDVYEELGSRTTSSPSRVVGTPTGDGSIPLPAPLDQPLQAVLKTLDAAIPRPIALLRFALHLLLHADMLYKDTSLPYLHAIPDIARLLLGPNRFEVLRDLFLLWLTHPSYEELYGLHAHGLRLRVRATSQNQPLLRSGELEAENSEARQSLLALLAQTPIGPWIQVNAFARFLYRIDPLFLQKRQRLFSSPHWWIEQEPEHPLHPVQLTDWLKAEFRYFTDLLRGPLSWWGICDLIVGDDDQILAFHLTPIARWLLHGDMDALQEQEPMDTPILPTPSLEVIDMQTLSAACSSTNWTSIETLERFTEIAGVREGRLRYLVTPKTLAGAMSRGNDPELLLTLLASLTPQQDIHTQLLGQLQRRIANYGRTRIYTGTTLLEAADIAVMRELSATTSLGTQLIQSIHPTLSLLDKGGAEQVIDELKRRGQTPLLHNEDIHGTR